MNKEEQMLQKRLLELSSIAYQRDIVTFSDFLNLRTSYFTVYTKE